MTPGIDDGSEPTARPETEFGHGFSSPIDVGQASLSRRIQVALWALRIVALVLTGMVITVFVVQL